MSYTKFSIHPGLYDVDFVETDDYDTLHKYLPLRVPQAGRWRGLSISPRYHPTRLNVLILHFPALRYIYSLLNKILTSRGNSTGVVSSFDFTYLTMMMEHVPLHLW